LGRHGGSDGTAKLWHVRTKKKRSILGMTAM
jgi:hypothetical protein